jgi:2'-5' RNA ligase
MRAFVGIPVECSDKLRLVIDELRSTGADLKVVPPSNLHVTVKFLGEIPDAQAPVILERMRSAGFPSGFEVNVQGAGAFPDWKKFNVIWANVRDTQGELAASFALSERLFAELGFPVEPRPFTAHVTLARRRSDRGKEDAKRALERHRTEDFGNQRVPGPVLFRSHLGPQGPTYERLGGVAA